VEGYPVSCDCAYFNGIFTKCDGCEAREKKFNKVWRQYDNAKQALQNVTQTILSEMSKPEPVRLGLMHELQVKYREACLKAARLEKEIVDLDVHD
jgi:hypothetical protein